MRITNNMMVKNMMRNMNNNLTRMDKIQKQMATGKKFELPSDDPIGVSRSLKLHTDLSKIEQYERNVDDAVSWLEITEESIAEIGEVLQRTREITVQAANGSNADGDLQKIGEEVKQLKQHIIKVANTTYAGRSIFSGYKTDAPLFDEDGKYKMTKYTKTGGTPTVDLNLKNSEVSTYNVGVSEKIDVNTVGISIFGKVDASDLDNGNFGASAITGYKIDSTAKTVDGTNADKSYVIEVFDQLETAMNNADSEEIGNSLSRIDDIMGNLLAERSKIGAKQNRLELTQDKLSSQTINFTELLSKNEDADMAEVIMNLKMEENVYRSSLSAGAKIIQPTLVDFLR